ncbi:hypothetical protein OQA88_11976 [Cercophora sp. LCS_1]
MPPSSGTRQDSDPTSNSTTTISIVLILVIPTVLLIGLCAARKTRLFTSIRTTTQRTTRRPPKHPGAVAGDNALQLMPIVKYDPKIFASLDDDPETGYTEDEKWQNDAKTPRRKQLLRGAVTALGRLDWTAPWSKKQKSHKVSFHKEPPPRSSTEASSPEIWARKIAMQTCAVCTEDFKRGVNVRKLPCGHIFHPGCIDPWLLSFAATCPLC